MYPTRVQNEKKYQKIYASMECRSSNVKIPGRDFGDISQLTNWILDSGATCHMIPDILDFVMVSRVERNKYIKVADENFVTSK